jgi:hypothetical protein
MLSINEEEKDVYKLIDHLKRFKNIILGKNNEDPIKDASMTRKNNKNVQNKGWYHPDTDTLVPVEQNSVYHTREVAINPAKFGITDETLHGFYDNKNSKKDSQSELSSIRNYNFEDWSDEIVHGMHDRGWLRINHNQEAKTYYIGGNSANHIATGIKKLVQNKVITHGYRIQAHVYPYGSDGFGGHKFQLSHTQAKNLK